MLHAIVNADDPECHAPGARLEAYAVALGVVLSRPERMPDRWRSPRFAHRVDSVRAHLRMIHSLVSLEASYAREGFHRVAPHGDGRVSALADASATEVAYAYRWLELAEGASHGRWASLVETAS